MNNVIVIQVSHQVPGPVEGLGFKNSELVYESQRKEILEGVSQRKDMFEEVKV